MSELGRLLTEARTSNDLSLAEVEAATRVRQKYLEALEQGDYASLPPGAIARGFLRNYARYLGLDDGELLHLYAQESGDRGSLVPTFSTKQVRAIDYRPLEVSLINDQPTNHNGWVRWILALVAVVLLVVAAWWVLNNNDTVRDVLRPNFLLAFGPQSSSTGDATATRPALVTITPPAAPGSQQAVGANTADQPGYVPSPTSDLLTLPIPTTPPTVTPTSPPKPTTIPKPATGISLTLKITQRSWTKVTVDGKVVMQDLLEAGQERSWPANDRVEVLTGNAAGINVSINGQELGAMGGVGAVVDRIWAMQQGQMKEVVADQPKPGPTPTP